MTRQPTGDNARKAHERFRRHDERTFMVKLRRQQPDATSVERSHRNFKSAPAWVSAILVICAGGGLWFFMSGVDPQQAYGVVGVRDTLMQCKNMRVKGRRYQPVPGGAPGELREIPFEWYVERPGFYWITTGDDPGSYAVGDGSRHVDVNATTNTATTGRESPFTAEVRVERIIQRLIVGGVLGDSPGEHVKIGVDTVNSVKADVYEKRFQRQHGAYTRRVVWVDRVSGLPVAAATYHGEKNGHERPFFRIDSIGLNLTKRPNLATVTVPVGFQVEQTDNIGKDVHSISSGHIGDERFEFRMALLIDHGAVLVCWHYQDDADKQTAPNEIVFSPTGAPDRAFEHHPLRRTWINGRYWNWSLFAPGDGDESLYEHHESFRLHVGMRKATSSSSVTPLRFERARLADVILQAQSSTVPPPVSNEPNSLEELMAIVSGGRQLL